MYILHLKIIKEFSTFCIIDPNTRSYYIFSTAQQPPGTPKKVEIGRFIAPLPP
jgi:hypothetical protein